METTNNYQDLNALLATLSSYIPPSSSNSQQIDNFETSSSHEQNAALAAILAGGQPVPYQNQAAPSHYTDYYPQQYAVVDNVTTHYKPNNAAATHLDHQITPANDYAHSAQPYDPSTFHNQAPSHHFVPQPQRTSTPSQLKSATPQVNPRTITTWPAAIRHVTFLATQNAHLAASIRKLIANQHDNERQWHASRVALLEKQKARVAGKRELDDVLRSVGALARMSSSDLGSNGGVPGEGPTDIQELQLYDRKVHRAAVQMGKAMTADLETLGVPFFGIEPGLVYDDDNTDSAAGISWKQMQKNDVVKPDRKGMVGKGELRLLQRRMISHLEDMYKD